MAQQTLNAPASPYEGPNTRDKTPEHGDGWKEFVEKCQAMFSELYAAITSLTASAAVKPTILAASAVESTVHTGDTNVTTLATINVPANTLGPNGRLRISALLRFIGTTNTKKAIITFGGTTFVSTTSVSASLSAWVVTDIANRNATDAQVAHASTLAGPAGNAAGDIVTGTIDTTADQSIVIAGQLTDGADSVALESYVVEVLKP